MIKLSNDAVLGCSEQHLVHFGHDTTTLLHCEVAVPLAQLQQAAAKQGFELAIASSFRSFERQLWLWNNKLSGQRPVLDDDGQAIDLDRLSSLDKIIALMRWSALPGTSRHHWGCDFDIYDKAAIDSNYQLQLVPEEYSGNGPFAPMMTWLANEIDLGLVPFYRPYEYDLGGVAPEPWHISYRPVAEQFEQCFNQQCLVERLIDSDILEKQTVVDHLEYLIERFVIAYSRPHSPLRAKRES